MKQTWKKIVSIVLMGVFFAALTACGGKKEAAGIEVGQDIQSQLIQSAQSAVEAIVAMDDATIQSYLESEDPFSVSAMEAWMGSREELGGYLESGNATLETDKDTITVTIPTKFEKEEAIFTVTFDKKYAATSMGVDVQYSMATKLERAGLNTVMGIGTVFVMLIFLSFLIYLIRFIPGLVESFGKKKTVPAVAPVQESAPAAAPVEVVEEDLADDGELVAVIAAAIAAAENTSTDGFIVRSIRKSNKRNWQKA